MTLADIEVDYWANHYADRRAAGQPDEYEVEDEDFDLEAILARNAAEAEAGDEWEDVIDVAEH